MIAKNEFASAGHWSYTSFPCDLPNWDERCQKEPDNGTHGYSFRGTSGTSWLVTFRSVSSNQGFEFIRQIQAHNVPVCWLPEPAVYRSSHSHWQPRFERTAILSSPGTSIAFCDLGNNVGDGALAHMLGNIDKDSMSRLLCASLFTRDYRAIPVLDTRCPFKIRLRHGALGFHNVLLVLLLRSDPHIARALPRLRVAHRRGFPSCPTRFDDSGSWRKHNPRCNGFYE